MDLMVIDILVILKPLLNFAGGLLCVAIFYWPGRWILRFLTNGRYPPQFDKPHNHEFVAVVAVSLLLILFTAYFS